MLAAFAATIAIGVAEWNGFPVRAIVGAAVALAAATPFFLMRSRVSVALGVLGPLAGAGAVLVGNGQNGNLAWFSVLVLVAWGAFAGGVVPGLAYWATSMAVLGAEWIWAQPESGAWVNWMAGTSVTALAALLLRQQFVLVQALRSAQTSLAERSAAEERNRIARELHDVIAHSLTVALLHVSSARLAVQTDPSEADEALAEAERLGRSSLDEIRATVGLLRSGPGDGLAPPVPTAAQVPVLVEQFRQAGAVVSLTVDGDISALPATTGLALYRISQEALTNAAKHATGAPVFVNIVVGHGRADVHVESAGPPRNGTGQGLAGIRERAAALGGTSRAGPGGSGWVVEASLPVPGAGRVRG
jgi:signal transduction histidine kinase